MTITGVPDKDFVDEHLLFLAVVSIASGAYSDDPYRSPERVNGVWVTIHDGRRQQSRRPVGTGAGLLLLASALFAACGDGDQGPGLSRVDVEENVRAATIPLGTSAPRR